MMAVIVMGQTGRRRSFTLSPLPLPFPFPSSVRWPECSVQIGRSGCSERTDGRKESFMSGMLAVANGRFADVAGRGRSLSRGASSVRAANGEGEIAAYV